MSEPTWTFDSKLLKLDRKIQEVESSVNLKLKEHYTTLRTAIQCIKSDIYKQLYNQIQEDMNQSLSNVNNSSTSNILLQNGECITGDIIQNRLNSLQSGLNSLNLALNRFDPIRGVAFSYNFKKSNPTQDQLYQSVIDTLSTKGTVLTRDKIPNSTKIKNTYDNHIWILNQISNDGLMVSKWEDFGADSVCIASNDGTAGIVAGSQERYMGFVDLQGRISINGLEEDLQNVFQSIQNISNELDQLKKDIFAKFNDINFKNESLEA